MGRRRLASDCAVAKQRLCRTCITHQSARTALLSPQQPSDVALALPHDYYYEIPLGIAECYHALGDYANAEIYYLQAVGYQYLNSTIEAPFVWIELANLYLDWGNSLFKSGDPTDALPIYSKVLTPDMKAPTSQLYTLVGLKPAWTVAEQVITNISTVTTLSVNPQIAAVIMDVRQQLLKIAAGLDFWGLWVLFRPHLDVRLFAASGDQFCAARRLGGAKRDQFLEQRGSEHSDTPAVKRQCCAERS